MKTFVVANWKMNPSSLKEAKKLFEGAKKAVEKLKNVDVVVAPPSLFLGAIRNSYKGKKIAFAGQNARAESHGSFTGDISMEQLKQSGCKYVIIGHAERRVMGETDADVQKKVGVALTLGITPIVCVGENQRSQDGAYFEFVRAQLRAVFAEVPAGKVNKVVIAYEPVWAIGATTPMVPHDMHEMSIFIRKVITEKYAAEEKPPRVAPTILYGGSVDETNAKKMLVEGDVSGLLVGRASVDSARFTALLNSLI